MRCARLRLDAGRVLRGDRGRARGASVVLVEPTNHVGGVVTGGLSFSDSNQTIRSTVMGLFDEWFRRVEADYTQARRCPALVASR